MDAEDLEIDSLLHYVEEHAAGGDDVHEVRDVWLVLCFVLQATGCRTWRVACIYYFLEFVALLICTSSSLHWNLLPCLLLYY